MHENAKKNKKRPFPSTRPSFWFQWSWRESNPRPNTLQKRFLHAYPWFDFRPDDGTRLYRHQAYPLKFRKPCGASASYPLFSDASSRTSKGVTSGETALCTKLWLGSESKIVIFAIYCGLKVGCYGTCLQRPTCLHSHIRAVKTKQPLRNELQK